MYLYILISSYKINITLDFTAYVIDIFLKILIQILVVKFKRSYTNNLYNFFTVVLPGTKAWKTIRKQFGDEVIHENGELNREKLGQIIFADASKRRLLNSITHPEIYKSMLWKILKAFVRGMMLDINDYWY